MVEYTERMNAVGTKTTYTPTKEGLSEWQRWKYAATQHDNMRSRAICVCFGIFWEFHMLPSLFLYTLARYPNFFLKLHQ